MLLVFKNELWCDFPCRETPFGSEMYAELKALVRLCFCCAVFIIFVLLLPWLSKDWFRAPLIGGYWRPLFDSPISYELWLCIGFEEP